MKQAIVESGIAATFYNGVLECIGGVSVRKCSGCLNVSGPLCKTYFKIRDIVLSRFSRV